LFKTIKSGGFLRVCYVTRTRSASETAQQAVGSFTFRVNALSRALGLLGSLTGNRVKGRANPAKQEGSPGEPEPRGLQSPPDRSTLVCSWSMSHFTSYIENRRQNDRMSGKFIFCPKTPRAEKRRCESWSYAEPQEARITSPSPDHLSAWIGFHLAVPRTWSARAGARIEPTIPFDL